MLALPGSAYVYQGEELGLPEHTTLPSEVRQDPALPHRRRERGPRRLPRPDSLAGGSAWLRLGLHAARTVAAAAEGFARYAVDQQLGVPGSSYELYRAALGLRADRKLGRGSSSGRRSTIRRPAS